MEHSLVGFDYWLNISSELCKVQEHRPRPLIYWIDIQLNRRRRNLLTKIIFHRISWLLKVSFTRRLGSKTSINRKKYEWIGSIRCSEEWTRDDMLRRKIFSPKTRGTIPEVYQECFMVTSKGARVQIPRLFHKHLGQWDVEPLWNSPIIDVYGLEE